MLNELSGATITLTDDKGNVQTWVSNGEVKEFVVTEGKYTFKETVVPNGYVVATDITFEVKRNAETQALEIVNVVIGEGNKEGTDGVLIMVDDHLVKPEKPVTPDKPTLPHTGQENNLVYGLLGTGVMLGGLYLFLKKEEDQQ